MNGRYQDRLYASDRLIAESGWRSNLIVDSAAEVLASLLARDRGAGTGLWWAVGAGDPAWDAALPEPDPATRALVAPTTRVEILPAQMRYLDGSGQPSAKVTPTLEIAAVFPNLRGKAPLVLREFGLQWAVDGSRGGTLLNYVAHAALSVPAMGRLERTLRISFQNLTRVVSPRASLDWLDVPNIPFARRPALLLDGMGATRYAALTRSRVASTLGELAASSLDDLVRKVPDRTNPWATLRARARLLLRLISEDLSATSGARATLLSDLASPSSPTVITTRALGSAAERRVSEQVSAIYSLLDHANTTVAGLTLGGLFEAA